MTWYADLGPIDYFRSDSSPSFRAVGWLGEGHPFPQDEVSTEFFDRLCMLLVDPWDPHGFRGFHECEFCPTDEVPHLRQLSVRDQVAKMGVNNLFVPGDGCVYVAPSLIAHYIRDHRYAPPHVFVEAVLRCPEMHSEEYLKARRELLVDDFMRWNLRCREPRSLEYIHALRTSGAEDVANWAPWWIRTD